MCGEPPSAARPGANRLPRRVGVALQATTQLALIPHGYTLCVWASGALLLRNFGAPDVGQILLFLISAAGAFAAARAVAASRPAWSAGGMTGAASDVPYAALLTAIIGTVCLAAATAEVLPEALAWPATGLAVTLAYFVSVAAGALS